MVISDASELNLVELGQEHYRTAGTVYSHDRVAIVVPVYDDLSTACLKALDKEER